MLWPIRVQCVWIPAGLPCIFTTIHVLNFDMWQILCNVTYVSRMVLLMNFGSIKGGKIFGKLSNCQLLRRIVN
jgi:hypothetical protein